MAVPTKVAVKLVPETDRTLIATWEWTWSNVDHYEVMWKYAVGLGIGIVGKNDNEEHKQSQYTPPENAKHVTFKVKAIPKTKDEDGNDITVPWSSDWSTEVTYYFTDKPSKPPTPSVTIDQFTLTARVDNVNDIGADSIEFRVVKNDIKTVAQATVPIVTSTASYSCTITAGNEYKVSCRGVKDGVVGEWSDFSSNAGTIPSAPDSILELRALSETHVYLDWSKVSNATSYEIEYAKGKSRFDSSTETQKMTVDAVVSHAEVTGLETGETWYFRVRAVNSSGSSAWTDIKSVKLGKRPAPPTTWSSTTTAIVGEDVNLYWVHNSEDGSSQTYAKLELTVGDETTTEKIQNSTDEDEKDKTSVYKLSTSSYTEGAQILWRVQTRGIIPEYSEWSIQRTINVYAPPVLELNLTDVNGNDISTLNSFPFYVKGVAGPNTQTPIGYHIAIKAKEAYETVDNIGNPVMVSVGEEVFSEYLDISTELSRLISAGDIRLENNVIYTITCVVSMNSGLTAEASINFTTAWADSEVWADAEIGYDKDTYTTIVRPYCADISGALVDGVTMSIYRREFNGKFTELATGLDNVSRTFIVDPHPALDYARYRVVATHNSTGAITYYDIPGYPIGEKSVIIQWNEDWTYFDTDPNVDREQPPWSGSLLRLPYNIDISDSHENDVEIVKYIGREDPVTYYGTQRGMKSTWNVEIAKSDTETLYALRRLAAWMGDVYVREPSGSGYWANISVSFSQKHTEVTIPVTLDITRVAGGM